MVISMMLAAAQGQPAGGAGAAAPAPVVQAAQTEDYSAITVPDLSKRLEALSPANPQAYFDLAEEVAAVGNRDARRLARRLYVLAFVLDRPPRGDGTLGQSACLGLIALTPRPGERRWLAAVSAVIESDRVPGGVLVPPPEPAPIVDAATGYQLSMAIALVRGGEGRRAASLLKRPAVSSALDNYARVLEDRGSLGVASEIRQRAESYPFCSDCKNRRTVNRVPRAGEPPKVMLCPTCEGLPGQRFTQAEFLTQIAMEAALLRGIHRLWSAQALSDGGEPLRDPEPEELPAWYGIDATRCLFRGGAWVADGPR
jgi:hypothetical protein